MPPTGQGLHCQGQRLAPVHLQMSACNLGKGKQPKVDLAGLSLKLICSGQVFVGVCRLSTCPPKLKNDFNFCPASTAEESVSLTDSTIYAPQLLKRVARKACLHKATEKDSARGQQPRPSPAPLESPGHIPTVSALRRTCPSLQG